MGKRRLFVILFLVSVLTVLCSSCTQSGLFVMTPFDVVGAPVAYDDSAANAHLAVAAVSLKSDPNNKAANLAAMASMVARVKGEHPDVQVIAFGELVLGSLYEADNPVAYQRGVAETIPGDSTAFVGGLCARYGTAIVFGMAEEDNGTYYNSQAIVFPDGTVLKYRKRGLNSGDAAAGFTPGMSLVTATIGGVKVTFMICSDYQDSEAIRDVAKSDAAIVLMSLGNQTRLSMENDFIAREVNKWVVHANRYDPDFGVSGLSYVADAAGSFRVSVQGESVYAYFNIGVYQ